MKENENNKAKSFLFQEKAPKFNNGQFVQVLDENIFFSEDEKNRDGFIINIRIKDNGFTYVVISSTEYSRKLRSKILDCKGSDLAVKLKNDFANKKIYSTMFELTNYLIPENQLVALSDEVENSFIKFVYKLLPKDPFNDSQISLCENKGWDLRLPGD